MYDGDITHLVRIHYINTHTKRIFIQRHDAISHKHGDEHSFVGSNISYDLYISYDRYCCIAVQQSYILPTHENSQQLCREGDLEELNTTKFHFFFFRKQQEASSSSMR